MRSTLLRALPLLAALAACSLTGSSDPLVISGTVTRAGTTQPVPSATVQVWSRPLDGEGDYLMETTQTNAQGAFTVRIEKQKRYGRPNCRAMEVIVSAAGYTNGGQHGLGPDNDRTCVIGIATVDVSLTPLP
ncbi:MAG TPA: hypothetical protein VGX50_05190 [Longimicrobium sp.]|jgi:hypothetical protein|nr:hypothetical protein [Longimicrobium sp.]